MGITEYCIQVEKRATWCSDNILRSEEISERIMCVDINSKLKNFIVIHVYGPTGDNDDDEIERFYEELGKTIKNTKNSNNCITVMGDMNAKVGNERDGYVVGLFGVRVRNKNGSRLVEFCWDHKYTIAIKHSVLTKRKCQTYLDITKWFN